jgi:hypothetical protein
MLTDDEINKIADYFRKNIQTIEPLGDGYYYNHLSLCVIDAVWSIGVRYEGVKNVVQNYCAKRKLVDDIFDNHQRTSTKNGILKAKAVIRFAKVLSKYNVNYFQEIAKNIENNKSFEKNIKHIPGQKSGLSLNYFYMLAGNKNKIKADRMIKRFLAEPININRREHFLWRGKNEKESFSNFGGCRCTAGGFPQHGRL